MNETAASGLTVLRMRLPYVDQRSLSEAWISALGLRRDSEVRMPAAAAVRGGVAFEKACDRATRPGKASAGNAGCAGARVARRYAADRPQATALPAHSASAVSASMRTVRPLAVHARSYPARRSSLTLGVAGTRVQLVLRREGAVLHVVALCRSDVAQAVGLALARAEFYLRARGDALRASVRTYDEAVGSR